MKMDTKQYVASRESRRIEVVVVLFISIGLLLLYACQKENTKNAFEQALPENTFRERVGLRLIERNWICRSFGREDVWYSSQSAKFAGKVVRRDSNGSPLQEEDRYASGRSVAVPNAEDAVLDEEIVLSYDYLTKKMRVSYIGVDREIESASLRAETNDRCLALIKSVREKWKISGRERVVAD